MLYDDTINIILCLEVVFCFDGFNCFMRFSMGRIMKNDHCLIKTIKTENITQTQYRVMVSSQSIAVNK